MSVTITLTAPIRTMTARRGFIAQDEPAQPQAPRRALTSEPPAYRPGPPVDRSPRRRAPVRALLSRLLLGGGDSARRALVDLHELLADELFRLSSLDPRWGFLQSARLTENGSEFDHWVIGPGGIYLLSAKHLPGSNVLVDGDQFLVNGQDRPFVPEMRDEALRNSASLSSSSHWDIEVNGVIVPYNDRRLTVQHSPDDVAVVDDHDVANWLVNRPEMWNKQKILSAFDAAREGTANMPRFNV